MKLIVGLGNYPPEYAMTRHNTGFLFVEQLAKNFGGGTFKEEKKFFGQVSEISLDGEKVLLLKPQTYMNLSGKAVGAMAHFYKIQPHETLLVFDDIDLPFGEVRFREKGASGGHNGVKSVIQVLGTQVFPRIKIGVANPLREKLEAEDFVLQKFNAEELSALAEVFEQAEEKLLEWLSH